MLLEKEESSIQIISDSISVNKDIGFYLPVKSTNLPSCLKSPVQEDKFEVGALIALGMIAGIHDHPSMAADIAREMQLENADISGFCISEYDQDNLSKLNREGLNIKY